MMNTTPLTVVSALALTLLACGRPGAEKPAADPSAREGVRPVRSMVVSAVPVGETMYLPGDVRARFEQRLGFRVGGKLATRHVEVGDVVKPGQVIATLDSQDLAPQVNAQAAQWEAARANAAWQSADLARQRELREKGFISAAALQRQELAAEAAKAQERAAAAALTQAQNAVAFQTLRADRAGVVVGVEAEVGTVVAAGQPIVRIALLGARDVLVNVPERAVGRLKEGQVFSAIVEAAGNRMTKVSLRELAPSADPVSRTYAARFKLLDDSEAIKLGMTATVHIEGEATHAIVVPLTAIVSRDQQARVWVVNEDLTVQPVAVSIGGLTPDGVIITAGLRSGQRVVTAGANLLIPNQKVRLERTASTIPAAPQDPTAQRPAAAGANR